MDKEIQQLMSQYGVDSEDALLEILQNEQQTPTASAQEENEVIQVNAKPMLNIKQWAEHEGAKLIGTSPTGNAILETKDDFGDTVKMELDPIELLKSEGEDPSKWNIQLNTPETATDDSALGFADALQFEFKSDQASRLQFLTERFGEENVAQGPRGEIKVKDADGLWKRGDTTFMQTIGADAPAIAASLRTGLAGARIGALGGPLAMMGLAAAGGAMGYVAARYGTREFANALGLIDDADVEAYKNEAGKELAFNFGMNLLFPFGGMALSKGAAKLAPIAITGKEAVKDASKMVGHGIWAATKPVTGLMTYPIKIANKTYNMFTSGPQMADMLKSVYTKVKPDSWETMLHSREHLGAVQGYIKELGQWVDNPKAVGEIDPVLGKMAGTIDHIFKRSKQLAQASYNRDMNVVKPAIANLPIDLHKPLPGMATSSVTNFLDDLKGLGLVDDVGKFLPPELEAKAIQVVPPGAERESLKNLYKIATQLKKSAEVPMADVEKALAGIDNVLDKADVFKGNPRQISTQVERLLIKFRSELASQASDQLRGRTRVRLKNGHEVDAGFLYQSAKQAYHTFRAGQEDFLTSLKGQTGSKDSMLKALAKNFANPEVDFKSNFRKMTGGNEFLMDKLVELERMTAARDIALNGYGLTGFKGPIMHVFGLDARGAAMSRAATWATNAASRKQRTSKASFTSILDAQALGKASNWFSNLKADAKQRFLSDPNAINEFKAAITSTGGTANITQKWVDQQLGKR